MFHNRCLLGALNSGVPWILGSRRVTTTQGSRFVLKLLLTLHPVCLLGHIWMCRPACMFSANQLHHVMGAAAAAAADAYPLCGYYRIILIRSSCKNKQTNK